MNKKVVIAGSASNQEEIKKWVDYWINKGFDVVNYPKSIDGDFIAKYPEVHKQFFQDLIEADILFVANYDKNDIVGYIGAETFAEIAFVVTHNLLYNKNIKIILAQMPSEKVQPFREISNWLKLGWLDIL